MNRHIRTILFLALIAVALGVLGGRPALATATAAADDAPGRTMAQQATKALPPWNTTDHSKHAALKQEFKSGQDITNACLSCHSEAATQFHRTIHWTWQASADGEEAKYGKAAQSLNNFCISANRNQDTSCLSCHPG